MFDGPADGIWGSDAHERIDDLDKHLWRRPDEGQPTHISGWLSAEFCGQSAGKGKFKLDAWGLSSTTELMRSESTRASCNPRSNDLRGQVKELQKNPQHA